MKQFTALINASDGEGVEYLFAIHFETDKPENMAESAVYAYDDLYGEDAYMSWGGEIVAFIPGHVQVHTWNATQGTLAGAAEEAWRG
jgi:hypothetical protein